MSISQRISSFVKCLFFIFPFFLLELISSSIVDKQNLLVHSVDTCLLSDLDITHISPVGVHCDPWDHRCVIFTLLYLAIPEFKNELPCIFCDACPLSLIKLVNISNALRTVRHVLRIQRELFVIIHVFNLTICFSYEIVSYD